MKYKYIAVRETYLNGEAERTAYGIAAVREYDGCTVIIEHISDVCTDCDDAVRLADLCNSLELDISHLRNVVEDFLASL